MRAGALVTLAGVVVTLVWLPARARQTESEPQAEEFVPAEVELGADAVRT